MKHELRIPLTEADARALQVLGLDPTTGELQPLREAKEADAEAIAAAVVRHFGSEAPDVLARALELARAKVRW